MPPLLLAAKPALSLVGRFWWLIPIAGLAIALFITRGALERRTEALEATKATYAQFQADVKAKTELARLQDAAHKARVERDQNQVTLESEDEIRRRIAAAVNAVRVRSPGQANPRSCGAAPVPGSASAPERPAGGDHEAIVPARDLEICATNTVIAEGWQEFWRKIQAIER